MKRKTLNVIHPIWGVKINATINGFEKERQKAVSSALKIEGGFVLYNRVTKEWAVFYPTPLQDVANKK